MATIRKKGDYQWHVQIRRKGFPVQTKTFDTKADAEKWASVIESEMARNVFRPAGDAEKTTLAECLDRYQREITPLKKGKGPANEESKIRVIMREESLCCKLMAAIRGQDIAMYRDKRLKEVSPATVNKELFLISNVFTIARKEWGMENITNPVEAVRKPKAPKGRDRRLTGEEIDRLLAGTESKELGAIILLAIETAMRRGEIVGLMRKNIHFKRRTLTLPDTKNGEVRVVPLSSKALDLLKSITPRISGRVFGMTPNAVTQAFDRACRRAGLDDLRFHDLRHEATSRFFESGKFDMMDVASITGHKTLQMLKRYTHLRAEDLAKRLE